MVCFGILKCEGQTYFAQSLLSFPDLSVSCAPQFPAKQKEICKKLYSQ